LTASQLFAKELLYNEDFNDDEFIGDAILKVFDDVASTGDYRLYELASGCYAVGPAGLKVGDHAGDFDNKSLFDSKGRPWVSEKRPLALNYWIDEATGNVSSFSLMLIPQLPENSNEYWEDVFAVSADLKQLTRRSKGFKLSKDQIAVRELLYHEDFDKDGNVGGSIESVVDQNDQSHSYSLYRTSFGGYVVGETDGSPGEHLDQLDNYWLLLNEEKKEFSGQPWDQGADKIGFYAYPTQSSSLQIDVLSVNVSGKNTLYTEETFASKWWAPNLLVKAHSRKVAEAEIFAVERRYAQDFNGDAVIGDLISVVLDPSDKGIEIALYKLQSGALAVAAYGWVQGDLPDPFTVLFSNDKFDSFWSPEVQNMWIAIQHPTKGASNLVTILTARSGKTGTTFDENFFGYWAGASQTFLSKTLPVSKAALIGKEVVYGQDFNGDGVVGEAVFEVIDSSDSLGEYGLYKTSTKNFVVSYSSLVEADLIDGFAIYLSSGNDGAPWATSADLIGLSVRVDVKAGINLSIICKSFNGDKEIYSEQKFLARDHTNATVMGSAVTLTLPQLLSKEHTYNQDLNGDGMVGDSIVDVIDASTPEEDYGLYRLASGVFVLADAYLTTENQMPEKMTMLLASNGAPWTTNANPLALNFQEGLKGLSEVTLITVSDAMKPMYSEEVFRLNGVNATFSRKSTLSPPQVFSKEVLYRQDLNGDGFIGEVDSLRLAKVVGVENYDNE
jgi:hypothetical protein